MASKGSIWMGALEHVISNALRKLTFDTNGRLTVSVGSFGPAINVQQSGVWTTTWNSSSIASTSNTQSHLQFQQGLRRGFSTS